MSAEASFVSDIVIVPPFAERSLIVDAASRLEDYLCSQFPKFRFEIARLAPVSDKDEFIVLPVTEWKSIEGDRTTCRQLEPWMRAEMRIACRKFADAWGSVRRTPLERRLIPVVRRQ